MRKVLLCLVLFIILIVNTSVISAQTDNANTESIFLPQEKTLLDTGKYDQLLPLLEKKYKEAVSANDIKSKAKYLEKIGDVYIKKCSTGYSMTLCSMGISKYDDLVNIADSIDDKKLAITLLNNVGVIENEQYYFTKAEVALKKALNIAMLANSTPELILTNKNLGELYFRKNMYDEALQSYQKALELIKQSGQEKYSYEVLNDLAIVFNATGKFDQAKEIYNNLITALEKAGNKELLADTIVNLAGCEIDVGNYKEAIGDYVKAITIYKQLKNRKKLVKTNLLAGEALITIRLNIENKDAFAYLNDLNRSLECFTNALNLSKESYNLDTPRVEKKYENPMFEMSDRLTAYQKSLSSNCTANTIGMETCTRSAMGACKVLYLVLTPIMSDCKIMSCKDFKPEDISKMIFFNDRDRILNKRKEMNNICTQTNTAFKKLLQMQVMSINKMIPVLTKRGATKEIAELYQYMALSYDSLGQYDKAILYMTKTIDIKKSTASADLWYYYYQLAGFYRKTNNTQQALASYQTAMDLVLDISHNIANEKNKLAYMERKRLLFRDYADLKKQTGDIAGAMELLDTANMSEQADMLTLKKQSVDVKAAPRHGGRRYARQMVDTKTRASKIAQDITREAERPPELQDKAKIDSLKNQLQQVRADFQKTALQVQQDSPDLLKYVAVKPSNMRTIQRSLPADCILIQPVMLNDKIVIFMAPSGDKPTTYKEISADSNELLMQIIKFRKALINPDQKEEVLKSSTGLYNILIKPIEADITPYKTLLISPYENLRYIPFQALYDGKNYLVEKYAIVNLSSSSSLKIGDQKPTKIAKLLAFGNATEDLPAAEKEVNDIKKNFTDSKLFIRKNALKDTFDNEIYNDFNVVHLATHGILNSDDPDKSRLVFAGTNNNCLSVADIMAYDFSKKDLIVLSACDSNVGKAKGAEVMSLGSAFEMAAAPSVIATLWKVNDASTSMLMNEFYKDLAKGMSKADALKEAQISLIRSEKYNNPYYWAPFVLLGEWK